MEEFVHELPGLVCAATISRFQGYCGTYSHWKFMDVPMVQGAQEVTLDQCIEARNKGICVALDGKRLKIAPGQDLLYQFVEDTYCQGVSLPLHKGTLADESLVLTQIKFSLIKEIYIRNCGKVCKNYPAYGVQPQLVHRWALSLSDRRAASFLFF